MNACEFGGGRTTTLALRVVFVSNLLPFVYIVKAEMLCEDIVDMMLSLSAPSVGQVCVLLISLWQEKLLPEILHDP